MRSNIKLYGPPIYDAIKALERMSIDMPEVCIMDTILSTTVPSMGYTESDRMSGTPLSPDGILVQDYFQEVGEITIERCNTIISKSGEKLGDNDFYFEWFTMPTVNQVETLIKTIDKTLAPLGVRYSITTK